MAATDRDWITYADGLELESETRKEDTPLTDAELNTQFMRGHQAGGLGPPSPYHSQGQDFAFTMNLIDQQLKRHAALLTDSRPQMDVIAYATGRSQTAAAYKKLVAAVWDERNFEQAATRELIRAGTVGSSICIPMWDETADYGRGDLAFRMYDPRAFKCDPSVVKAVDLQSLGEFCMVREVLPLNLIRERYPIRGQAVQPTARWSRYGSRRAQAGTASRGIATAMQRPWRRRDDDQLDSLSPRAEVRHTWMKDWPRDERGQPQWSRPRHIRYVVDAENVILKDEVMRYVHGRLPAHIFDWGIEFEHPFGIPMVSGLRRIQYTLNRIIGQVMANVILTNRVKIIGDANAIDAKTWQDLALGNPNGILIRKRAGHTFQYELPANVVPPYVIQVIQFLLSSIDLVTGMSEASSGRMPRGQNVSGAAIDALQVQAQSVIRLIARNFESWLDRIFQDVLPLMWQYFTTDRVYHYLGKGTEFLTYEFERDKFVKDDNGQPMGDKGWQDFEFHVLPGSSLATTRIQRGVMALNLRQAGLLPGVDVLKAAEWPDPEDAYQRAQQEMQQGAGPGGARGTASRRMLSVPGVTRRSTAAV